FASHTPLPTIPNTSAAAPPKFPLLTRDSPLFIDLERQQQSTFNVSVDQPALYRLESTGLLATAGNLRTRVHTSLFRQEQNGVGRNFLIQQYLGSGDYQLTVAALNQSTGRIALQLGETALLDGGQLSFNQPARYNLAADHSLGYRFHIAVKGRYQLQALGAGAVRTMRLEDSGGWPIISPNTPADTMLELNPGDYRIIIQPKEIAPRVVTLLAPPLPEPHYTGHGPHPLPLNKPINHQWLEPEANQPRLPDAWHFTLPAKADVTISLTSEMLGELQRVANGVYTTIILLSSLKAWQGDLEAGDYRLLLNNARINNQVDYSVTVATQQLLVGQTREISGASTIPLSVAGDGVIELSSYGMQDLRARLFDSTHRLIAHNDDRQDDWNFLLRRPLATGFYTLRVEPLGALSHSSRISMALLPKNTQAESSAAEEALITVTLTEPEQKSRQVTLPIAEAQIELAPAAGPLLVIAESRNGQPGVQLLDKKMGSLTRNSSVAYHAMASALLSAQHPSVS
ncbi:MAG: hypothetical protein FD130_1478, partial [Halothiobacillaceae bacterium]